MEEEELTQLTVLQTIFEQMLSQTRKAETAQRDMKIEFLQRVLEKKTDGLLQKFGY